MLKIIFSALASAAIVSLVGCADPRQPNMDLLAVNAQSSASGSSDALQMHTEHGLANEATDGTTRNDLTEVSYDARTGFTVQEGRAGIIRFVAVFDDRTDQQGLKELGGALHLAGGASDVADVQLLPKEDRRFVVIGKKTGHTDISFTIDGAGGTVTVPVDVVATTP